MIELTEEQKAYLDASDENAKGLGIETKARQIAMEEYKLDEDNYMKFNIPSTNDGFQTGNGEGVWGHPLTPEDNDIYKEDSMGKLFKVVLLNDALSFPFAYGSVLTVETRGAKRPVINYKWLDETIQESEPGLTLSEVLETING